MTVDVEDYFQVSAFESVVNRDRWPQISGRVEASTQAVLVLLDEAHVKATFFTLGWIAERYPGLVRRIVDSGHELASHGFDHRRVSGQGPEDFRADVRRTKRILEDISGVAVNGYRAASFSIDASTPWAHEILAEEGHAYSSSVFPVRHDHYGVPDAPRFAYRPAGPGGLIEVPPSTIRVAGRNLPCAGGGYFRLLPYTYFRWALHRVNSIDGRPAIFYFHPWEIDADQPRQPGLKLKTRFRHYVNLRGMRRRLATVLAEFAWDRMDSIFLDRDGGRA